MNIGELVATIGADISQLRAAVRQAEKHFKELENAAKGVSKLPIGASTDKLTKDLKNTQDAFKNAKDSATAFNDDLLKMGRTLASFAAIFYTIKNAFKVFAVGIEFNKVMEDTRVSLTGLVASMYEYRDANGKVLTGLAAYEAAQKDVIGLQQEMRVAGLLTAATYTELMEAMQQAFAPAKNAGVALGQMVPFVQRLTQVAQTAGVPMHMLNEEVRSFTTGAMTRRTTRIMPFMEEIGLTNTKIKEFIKSGTLFTETMKRTEQIAVMAAKSTNTWTVALSNLYDWFQNIMGVGLESTFRELVALFLEMTDYIGRINKETGAIEFNATFLNMIQEIDQTFRNALIAVRNFAVELGKFQEAHPVLTELLTDVGGIGLKLLALGLIVRTVVGVFGFLGKGAVSGLKNVGDIIKKVVGYILMFAPSFKGLISSFEGLQVAATRFGVIRTIFAALLNPIGRLLVMIGTVVTTFGAILLVGAKVALVLGGLSAILALFGNYTIPNAAVKLWDWIKTWEILGVTVEDAMSYATAYLNKFTAYLFGIDLYDVFDSLLDFFKNGLPKVISSFKTFISQTWKSVTQSISQAWTECVAGLKKIWGEMPQWFQDVCDEVLQGFKNLIADLKNWANVNPIKILMEMQIPSAEEMAKQIPGMTAADVEKARQSIDNVIDPLVRNFDELPKVAKSAVDKSNKELKRLGEGKQWQAAETFFGSIKDWEGYKGASKKTQKESEKAGKSAESAINRWRSMMDTLDKEIAKASDNSIAQIDAWSNKFYNDLMNIAEKSKGLISQEEMWQGITKVNQATTEKLTNLWEDYTKWYAQNTNDRLEALRMEQREITQKYTDMKNKLAEYQKQLAAMPTTPPVGVTKETWDKNRKELINKIEATRKFVEAGIQIPVVFDIKNAKEFQKLVQDAANAYKEQFTALQGVTPDMAEQARLGLVIVQLENKISDSKYIQDKLERDILIKAKLWTDEDERRVKAIQEQVKYYKMINAIVEDLKTGVAGIPGLFAAWSYDRMKDMSTRAYESFKSLMDDIERDMSDAISGGIIDALRGKETDFSEMLFAMAEKGLKRAVDGFVTAMFDQLASWGAQMVKQMGGATGGGGFLDTLTKALTGKPDGSEGKPYWVKLKSGMGDGLESLLGGTGGYPTGFNPTEAGYGGWPLGGEEEYQQTLQQNVAGFYQNQSNWFTNLLGITSGSQNNLMNNTSNFYNQQTGFFGNLLGQLPGWFGKLGGVIGSLFDSLINGISGLFGGGGGGGLGGLLGGLFGGLFGGAAGGGQTSVIAQAAAGGFVGAFQHGGFVKKPTLAVIGEKGSEWVIPESKAGEFITQYLKKNTDYFGDILKSIPNVKMFGEGGYVTKPTLAMVAERGPELMIPERKISSLSDAISEGREGSRQEQNININTPIYISAPEPSRFQASREQIDSKRVSAIQRALRNL